MRTTTFKTKFEEGFYLRVRNNINTILNFDTTELLSLGLFLHLPIKISVEKVKTLPPKSFSSNNKILISFLEHFSAYTVIEDKDKIDFAVNFLFLYRNQKDLDSLYESLNSSTIREFLAFAYLHELQHILRRHTTQSVYSLYRGVVENYIKKQNRELEDINEFINMALDFAINYSLIEIIGDIDFKDTIFYNRYYAYNQMSEMSILKELLDNLDNIKITQTQKQSSKIKNFQSSITIKNRYSDRKQEITLTHHKLKEDKLYGDDEVLEDIAIEEEISNLANLLAQFIAEKQKGKNSQQILDRLGATIKTNSDWVKEILNSLLTITRDITHQYISTWSSLKNQYRKIGLFPNKKFLKRHTLIYASIDHSGSMSNQELRKLNNYRL